MPNYTKKRNKNDRIRKTFRNIIGGVKNNKGPYNNGKSYLTNRPPYGSYWPTKEVEHPSIMKRLTTTMTRFLPWSSKPQYMPPVEVPPMKTKTKEELREKLVRNMDLLNREMYYPKTMPEIYKSMIHSPKDEQWKKHNTIKKKPRRLLSSRRLRNSRKLRSSAN